MDYDAVFENVSGKIMKIFPPKGRQKGYTYSFKPDKTDGLKKYLRITYFSQYTPYKRVLVFQSS